MSDGLFDGLNRTKKCIICQRVKSIDCFDLSAIGRKREVTVTKSDWQSYCVPCRSEYERQRYADGSKKRGQQYLKKYGITIEEYESMLESQNNCCMVCGRECPTGRRLSIDHDHLTGKIRGLLCHKCNLGIGNFDDDPDWMLAAATYVLRFRNVLKEVVDA